MKQLLTVVAVCLLALTTVAAAADKPAPPQTVLPKAFAGWTQTGTPRLTTNAAQADPAYPGVLSEYGFAGSETATYTRNDGRTLTLKAARFNDATGAYGAFTFYRQPAMKTEQIGTKAASANQRILFFRSNLLVDANFDRVTEMSAAELRELAASLPTARGAADNLPTLPQYLPKQDVVENSAKYILGPQALLASQSPLTAELVDFSHDPEILMQDYAPKSGPMTLTILQYPTPQIAVDRLKALQANSGSLLARRSGPLVDVVTGSIGSGDAQALLNSVNYEAEVTWNQPTFLSGRDNVGNLIVGIFTLIGILLLVMFILGAFFGGFRILMKRVFPNRFDRPEDVEIIQLNLRESGTPNK